MKHRFFPSVVVLALVVVRASVASAQQRPEPVEELPYPGEALLTPKVRDTYSGDDLKEIRFPIGGVGSGCISMNGKGALVDWEVADRPNAQSRPDFTFIGLRVGQKGQGQRRFRVLEGPVTENLMGNGPAHFSAGGYGMGVRYAIAAGLPRFPEAEFVGRFPFAKVSLADPAFPVTAQLEGWSPFIPGNSDESSLPVAALRITLTNKSKDRLEAQLSFSQQNLAGKTTKIEITDDQTRVITGDDPRQGQMTYTVPAKAYGSTLRWHTAQWHGAGGLNYYVKDFVEQGKLPPSADGHGGVSAFAIDFNLAPGETKTIPYVITWCFPNRQGTQNYYATRHKDAVAVADYFFANHRRLLEQTRAFQKAFFDTNVPGVVTEAVSSQLAVLRSQTMFRMPDGALWGWEGCGQNSGCCAGTCLHVWHYAQSIAWLFPDIERLTREWDYNHRMTPDGHLAFRVNPDAKPRPTKPPGGAAADGQFGTIMRVYREWQISGDNAWLEKMWPDVKKSLEYAWIAWDVDDIVFTKRPIKGGEPDGMMTRPQHNTLDLSLNSWNTFTGSMYQAALLAGEKMARHVGDDRAAGEYRRLFESARLLTDKHLFNGDYYYQQKSETGRQYNDGCISEQLVGQWWASMMGLGSIYDPGNVKTAIRSLYRYNFLPSCRDHINTSCVFQLNDDAGLLICTWPKGGRPREDLFYADTFMVGYEDQVAANLIYQGYVPQGLAVTKAVRDRHNGRNRNPYSQLQAGNYYARSLANYSQLLAITGYRYSAVDKTLWLSPKISRDNLRMFFSTGTAWGTIVFRESRDGSCTVDIKPSYGVLELSKLCIDSRTHDLGKRRISKESPLAITTSK